MRTRIKDEPFDKFSVEGWNEKAWRYVSSFWGGEFLDEPRWELLGIYGTFVSRGDEATFDTFEDAQRFEAWVNRTDKL